MRIYFTDDKLLEQLIDVDNEIYSILTEYKCSAIKKTIYLGNDGYYEPYGEKIYKWIVNTNPIEYKQQSDKFVVTPDYWTKFETYTLPTNTIRIQQIIERFKIDDHLTFVIERNDEETVDYYIEYFGKDTQYNENNVISFLSKITNMIFN